MRLWMRTAVHLRPWHEARAQHERLGPAPTRTGVGGAARARTVRGRHVHAPKGRAHSARALRASRA
eukprot:2395085-Pleurochrysis_carterae.AAC.1